MLPTIEDFPDMSNADYTVDHIAKIIKKQRPDVWNSVYTKIIQAPNTYHSTKIPAVTMASSVLEITREKKDELSKAFFNVALATAVLEKYDFPTYFVSPSLFDALKHIHPPKENINEDGTKSPYLWSDIFLPFPGMIFMLPKESLFEQPTGLEIPYIAFAKHPSRNNGKEHITVFWSVKNGLLMNQCTIDTSQTLEPSPGWIEEKTKLLSGAANPHKLKDAPPAEFSSYVSGIIANLILIRSARPELIEEGGPTGEKVTHKKKHSKPLPFYAPTYYGKHYEIKNKTHEHNPTGAHFTELKWRSGYLRPHQTKDKTIKLSLVDPYICYGDKLIRPEQEETLEKITS